MQKLPKEFWKISFINEQQETEWDDSYGELDAGYRWQVDSALHYMIHYKKPWTKYPNFECDDCIDDLYLIDVSHKGIGKKIVHMMVYFNKEKSKLTPVHCETV